jgi:zinc protease
MMFQGSEHVPKGGHFDLVERAGGTLNATTWFDRTNYFETLPSHQLELALWLESDRMGWMLPAMTQEKLDNQRSVVINERRQSYENRPYGLAHEHLLAALYPPDHPYSWPTIGSTEDLLAATMDDVMEFFRTWYAPNNATLAVAGAVRSSEVRAAVHGWFGGVARGPATPPVAAAPARLESEHRAVMEDEVHLARLYMAWHSPAAFASGDAALDFAAHALAHGKASHLYRTLVYEQQIAQDVVAYQRSGRMGSMFVTVVTARPGTSLREIEQRVRAAVESIAADAITAEEIERARSLTEAGFVDELQTVGGFGGRADRLNLYAFHTGDAGFLQRDLERYLAVEPPDVAEAVRTHLLRPAAVLDVIPARKTP